MTSTKPPRIRRNLRIDRNLVLFLALFAIGAAIRIALLSGRGYESDVEIYLGWASAIREQGLGVLGRTVPCNYMPVFLEILGVVAAIAGMLGIPLDAAAPGFLILLKTPANLADLAASIFLFRALRHSIGETRARIAALSYWLNPALLFTSAAWGQPDSIVCLFTVLALLRLEKQRYLAAGIFLGLAIMTKLQPVMLLACFALYPWIHGRTSLAQAVEGERNRGFSSFPQSILRGVTGIVIATAVTMIPFAIAGNAGHAWRVVTEAVDTQPRLALGANNIWWLWFGDRARQIWDGYRWLDALSYRETGLLLILGTFLASVLIIVFSAIRNRHGRVEELLTHPAALHWYAFFLCFVFYMLPTQMHERYVLYSFPALLLACAYAGSRRQTDDQRFRGSDPHDGDSSTRAHAAPQREAREFAYSLFLIRVTAIRRRMFLVHGAIALLAFVTISANLVFAYPENAPWLAQLHDSASWITRVTAALNVLFLGVLLAWAVVRTRAGWLLVALPALFLAIGIVARTIEFRRDGTPLAEIRPTASTQDRGSVRINSSAAGTPLRSGGQEFERGLGTRARSMLAFRLEGRYERLTTRIGFDDRTSPESSARVVVLADRKPAFDSGVIRPSSELLLCEIDVRGVHELVLVVDHASPQGLTNDRSAEVAAAIDWLDPRLFR